jgi:hypothetical protein
VPSKRRWYVPYHTGSFHNFKEIEFDIKVSSWTDDQDDEPYIFRHRYDLMIFSNFLTMRNHVDQFRKELQNCARFLRNNGIFLVVGAKDSSPKYKAVYKAISEVVLRTNYGTCRFRAWCTPVKVEPSILRYRWDDAFGTRLKKQRARVYSTLKVNYPDQIPPEAASRLDASIQPTNNGEIEWQILVFKKHTRPRSAKRKAA